MKGLNISLLLVMCWVGFCNAQLEDVELILYGNTIGARNADLWIVFFEPEFNCFFPQYNQPFQRGDVNGDGDFDVFDVLHVFNWLGGMASQPLCIDAADVEDDGDIDIFDALRVFLWLGGQSPPPPPPCCGIPQNCGTDPTEDFLHCLLYEPCSDDLQSSNSMIEIVGKTAASRLMVGQVEAVEGLVTVPIDLFMVEPVVGIDAVITYDPLAARAVAIDNAGLSAEGFHLFASDVDDERGEIRIIGVTDIEPRDGVERLQAGHHRLLNIVFHCREKTLEEDVHLAVAKSMLAIDHCRALNHQVINGSMKVSLPYEFILNQNYPNPFNSMTAISYSVPLAVNSTPQKDPHITLSVYNVAGQVVRTLVDGPQPPGEYEVIWDGEDERGEQVASGIYFCRLLAQAQEMSRRMALIR